MNTVSAAAAAEVTARAIIRKTAVLSDDWGVLTKYTLSYRRSDGTWQDMTRETYDRGHGAVVLPYNPERGTIVLTRQFRLPAFVTGHDDDLIEACAGLLDARDPEAAIRKEAEEETGMTLGRIEKVGVFYMSPGSVTERLHFFIAPYTSAVDTTAGGGMRHEGEDIQVMETPIAEALQMIADGRIIDAKTVMLIQHLALGKLRTEVKE
jgi:GDP-mannose pyrophosphatase NudK